MTKPRPSQIMGHRLFNKAFSSTLLLLSISGCETEVRTVTLGIASAAFNCNPDVRIGSNLLEWAREHVPGQPLGNNYRSGDDSYVVFDLFQIPDAVIENAEASCLPQKLSEACSPQTKCPKAAEPVCVRIDSSVVEEQIASLRTSSADAGLESPADMPTLADMLGDQDITLPWTNLRTDRAYLARAFMTSADNACDVVKNPLTGIDERHAFACGPTEENRRANPALQGAFATVIPKGSSAGVFPMQSVRCAGDGACNPIRLIRTASFGLGEWTGCDEPESTQ